MGLPSSDSVAETFPTAVGNITNCWLIERITDTAPLSLLQQMSPGSPIQTNTKTLVSPLESVDAHLTSGSCLPVLLFPRRSINVHKAIPYGKTTLAWVDRSIGNAFIQSLDDRTRCADEATCHVRGRGGRETMFWDTQEVLMLTNAFWGPNPTRFNVDLINRIVQPTINSIQNEVQIELSQLVWKYIYQSTPSGWTITYNPRGPFVIIMCSGHCYVLIDTGRFLHPTPIKAHHLVPAYTSWHAIWLPQDLVQHPDITEILDAWKEELEGL